MEIGRARRRSTTIVTGDRKTQTKPRTHGPSRPGDWRGVAGRIYERRGGGTTRIMLNLFLLTQTPSWNSGIGGD